MERDFNKDESIKKRIELKAILEMKKKKKLSYNAIEQVPRKENDNYFVLSYEQNRLWVLQKFNPNSIMYNLYFGFRIYGTLDIDLFQEALNIIGYENESLRTKFQYINGEIMQVIEPVFKGQVNIINLSNVDDDLLEEKVREVAQRETDKPFDLEQGPLIRFSLIEISPEEKIFITVIHHIIFDGWSTGVFYRQLTEKYNQLYLGRRCLRETNKIQYGDYAEWQKKLYSQKRIEKQFNYWENRLKNIDQDVEFPPDKKRPKVVTGNGDVIPFELSSSNVEKLKKYAAENNCTVSVVLLSVYKCLIYKYTMKSDITVGTAVANRKMNGTEDIIGFFVNTLVLVTELDGNMKFTEVLERVRNTTLEAYDNQDIPFEQLVEKLSPIRDASRNPFFQLVFNYINTPRLKLELENLRVEEYQLGSRKSLFDVSLQIEENEDRIFGFFGYNSDLFFSETIKKICNQFQLLLNEVLKDKNISVNEISILSQQERNLILNEFNNTYVKYPNQKTVVELFEEQVEKAPNNIAVVYMEKKLTYKELNQKANVLAVKLRQLGVKPNEFVAIVAKRSLEMIIGILGILKSGGAYVPIDIEYPEDRISYMLNDSKPKVIVSYEAEIKSEGIPIINLKDNKVFQGEDRNPKSVNMPSDLSYVIYTSGTTGKPKGVMIENIGVVNFREYFIRNQRITEKDRILQFSSFAFDAMVAELTASLLTGASLYIISREEQKDTKLFERFVENNEITMAILPPQYLGQVKLKGIKSLISAGSETNAEIVKANSKYSRYFNAYGPTEVTVCATHWCYKDEGKIPEKIPIGKPIENKKIYIMNEMSLCGIGIPGELCIAGVGLARGYLNNLELTAEKFINNPYGEGRMYRTGDLARWLPDGNIEYLGRIDEQVKIRGFRIELGEIENILRKIEYIKDVVVASKEDFSGEKAIFAYIVSDIQVNFNKIREKIRKELPEYMIPGYFMQIDEIPLTPNGKINKKALPTQIDRVCIDYLAPTNEMEEKLAKIWSEVLGVERIGINDNFFELGGDSIKAIKAISKLVLDYKVNANDIFEKQTIAELSKKLSKDSMLDKILALASSKNEIASCINLETNNLNNDTQESIREQLKNNVEYYDKKNEIYKKVNINTTKGYEKILLCGATGYLGIYVLRDLLESTFSKIILIIRGNDINDSIEKLTRKFEFYFDKDLYFKYKERIIVLNGDISEKNLGLSNEVYNRISVEVQCIINCAANVKHYGKYDELYSVNVAGTKNLLEFSSNKIIKDYNHISTTSVGYGKVENQKEVHFTEYDFDIGQQNDNYYIQTKQIGEKLVLEARLKGVKCNILRVGNLVFNSENGKFQENIEDNTFYKLIKSYIKLSAFPIGEDMNLEFSFVNYASKAIVLLFNRQELVNETYHIFNANSVNISEFGKFVEKFIVNLKLIEDKEFLQYLLEKYSENPNNEYIINLLFNYSERLNNNFIKFVLKSDKTNFILDRLGFQWPILTEEHVEKMIHHCLKVNFLE